MNKNLSIDEAVIAFMEGRKGFEYWWNSIDKEIQKEIKDDLRKLIENWFCLTEASNLTRKK